MDGLAWNKFQQHEVEDSVILPSSNCNPYSNISIVEMISRDNFNPPQQIPKTDSYSNLCPQWNARSGDGSNWGATINAVQLNSSFQYNSPQIGPILDSGSTSPQRNILCGQVGVALTKTIDSLESIDCLLSASNHTDTTMSIKDDSMFSNLNNLWNNNSNSFLTVIESVQSITSLSENTDPSKDNTNCGTASKASPHQHEIENRLMKSSQIKRKRGESQQNLGFHHQANNSFQPMSQDHQKPKRPMLEKQPNMISSNINFQQPSSSASSSAEELDPETVAYMKEIIYRAAAFRPVDFGTDAIEKPKRKNVRISNDPQTVAARQRRERISERIRVLQRLVPGGSKMDTASTLDEAANYLKYLKAQIKALERLGQKVDPTVNNSPANTNLAFASPFLNYSFAMQQQQQPQFSIESPDPFNQPKS